jgi:hypothetical protein
VHGIDDPSDYNGNLLLGTMHNSDVVISTNGFGTVNQQARFRNNVGLTIYPTTSSSNTSTGALIVAGGAGIAGNLNVGSRITATEFNGNLSADVITPYQTGITVFNSATAIRVPVGDTDQRPAGLDGYIRYNTDTPALEYYTGNVWVPVTNTVTDQQIIPDGTADTFTLDRPASAVSIIVSINGTLQQPFTSYNVTGDQITFEEIPESTDLIDIRFLGASVTINNTLSDDLTVSGNVTVTDNITLGGILTSPQTTKAANDPGTIGQICWDADWIYVCTAADTWKRTPLNGGY